MKNISKTKYKKLEKQCVEIIIENSIVFVDEIFIFTEISPSMFYQAQLDKSAAIKDAIDINRAKLKRDLRRKWFDSTNATLNAALYKLVCSDEERRSLSAAGSVKQQSANDICTQEEFLKSLKEMGESLENADRLD